MILLLKGHQDRHQNHHSNQRHLTVNSPQPVEFQGSHSQDSKFDSKKTDGGSKNIANVETGLQRNFFSLEDESLLDEVFQDNW